MSDQDIDTKSLDEILAENGIESEQTWKLILLNDDYNSFEWVIYCLVQILQFSIDKAEQAAWTVHLTGRDVIKTGSKESLEPFKKLLEERGLTLSIEQ